MVPITFSFGALNGSKVVEASSEPKFVGILSVCTEVVA
jgi:hypothetical protein